MYKLYSYTPLIEIFQRKVILFRSTEGCPDVTCALACPNDNFQKDANGCKICKCAGNIWNPYLADMERVVYGRDDIGLILDEPFVRVTKATARKMSLFEPFYCGYFSLLIGYFVDRIFWCFTFSAT